MISSGALPKVTFSRPPIPGPERAASSSVARPISAAVGMIPSAAVKNTSAVARVRELEHDRERDERHQQVRPALRAEEEAGIAAWCAARMHRAREPASRAAYSPP